MAVQLDKYELHKLYRDLQTALNKHEPEALTAEDATEIKRLCLHLAAELLDMTFQDEGKD
jgi:tRNA C32,U32 (ribose-2'-O)-methylase TrmJ